MLKNGKQPKVLIHSALAEKLKAIHGYLGFLALYAKPTPSMT